MSSTPMRFELMRENPNGFLVHRLNRSATVSFTNVEPCPGLEPGIPCFGGRYLIHWANKAFTHTLVRHVIQTAPGLPIWSPTIVLTGPEGA
jgi:hypothetical protein